MNSYTVVDIQWGTSKVQKTYGRDMATITVKNQTTNKRYITYVIDGHKNVRNWNDVVEAGIGTKITFNGIERIKGNIIDADCVPHVVDDTSQQIFQTTDPNQVEQDIAILQGMILTYQLFNRDPSLIDQAQARLDELLQQRNVV